MIALGSTIGEKIIARAAGRALVRPGAFVAGGDSHTPMSGAFGAYAAGYGATDKAAIVVLCNMAAERSTPPSHRASGQVI